MFLVRVWLLVSTIFFIVLAGAAMSEIENTATVQATYGTQTLVSEPSAQSVLVSEGAPAVRLTKVIDRVEDTNENGVTDAGDTVFYTFDVLNTGNLTLDQIAISDPVAVIDVTTVGPLLPDARDTSLTASYVLQQEDIDAGGFENSATAIATVPDGDGGTPREPVSDRSDAGDEAVETPNLAGEGDDDPTNDPTVLTIEGVYDLLLAKTFVGAQNVFPYVYDVTYQLDLTNTGTVTARNLQMRDDLFNELDQATLVSVTASDLAGFAGAGGINPTFDGNLAGAGDAQILAADVSLPPRGTGTVTLVARLEFSPEIFDESPIVLENQADVTANGFADPVTSFDPNSDGDDTPRPTIGAVLDSDGDGAPDNAESTQADRDGDGIADAYDYDPTGYFYCEETGEILSGGIVSITDASGSSANVRIVSDGSDGYFQWFATAAGTYTMSYAIPPNAVESVDRPVTSSPLVLAGLPSNPTSIGSSEFADTGVLADFTYAANPYYQTFVIAENDPHVLNINIPVRFCSTPILAATKTVVSDPVLQADGRSALTYEMTLSNTGATRADDVNLSDDLAGVFGASRFEVVSLEISDAPSGFVATPNAGFDGVSDTQLLSQGGQLGADETVTVTLALMVNPVQSGDFTNVVTGTALSPLDGSQVAAVTAEVDVALEAADLSDTLLISKSVNPSRARIGDLVTFTITVENTADVAVETLTLVDSLPQGLAYRRDTAQIGGRLSEPAITGRTLRWADLRVGAGETVVATLQTTLTSRADVGVMTNQAWVADSNSGERVTLIAEASVTLIAEAVFQCSDIIGSVFNDRNMNGYQDGAPDLRALVTDQTYDGGKFDTPVAPTPEGTEAGVPNVRLVTPTGTVITTDGFGRYSVPCAELPKRAGANFTLKLDTRSLPSGYRVTTENPRTMRVTPGIFTEMNFGAATGRVIDVDLTAEAFEADGAPSAALSNGLAQLLRRAAQTPSVVKISYYRDSESAAVARDRLDATEALINDLWQGIGTYELIIERTIARFE